MDTMCENDIQLLKGNCYELIKSIPDKSVDLVYIDPPYQFVKGGAGKSEIAERKMKKKKTVYLMETKYDYMQHLQKRIR